MTVANLSTENISSLSSKIAISVLIENYAKNRFEINRITENVAKEILQEDFKEIEDKQQQQKDNRIKQAIFSALKETENSMVGKISAAENFLNQIENEVKNIDVTVSGFNGSREQEKLNAIGEILVSLNRSVVNAARTISKIKSRGDRAELKDVIPNIQISTSAAGAESIQKSINAAEVAQQILAFQDDEAMIQALGKSGTASVPRSSTTAKKDEKEKLNFNEYIENAKKDKNLNVGFSSFLMNKKLPRLSLADFMKLVDGGYIAQDAAKSLVEEFLKLTQAKK